MSAIVTFKHKGDFKNIKKFLNHMSKGKYIISVLNRYGQLGVNALASATPVDTGKTATSWTYEVELKDGEATISWNNTNVNRGINIALILQLGHGTGTGGYVQGRDYINPAIQPIFDKILNEVWKEVTSS